MTITSLLSMTFVLLNSVKGLQMFLFLDFFSNYLHCFWFFNYLSYIETSLIKQSKFGQVYEIMFISNLYTTVRNSDTGRVIVSRWGESRDSGSTSSEQKQQWYSTLRPTREDTDAADGCYRGWPNSVLRFWDGCFRLAEWEEQTSALSTPGTSMLASTRAQESFQSQLDEGLKIIASLPSALLWGVDRYVDRNYIIKSNYPDVRWKGESNFLSRSCQDILPFICPTLNVDNL